MSEERNSRAELERAVDRLLMRVRLARHLSGEDAGEVLVSSVVSALSSVWAEIWRLVLVIGKEGGDDEESRAARFELSQALNAARLTVASIEGTSAIMGAARVLSAEDAITEFDRIQERVAQRLRECLEEEQRRQAAARN
jgi:hypothetical protein